MKTRRSTFRWGCKLPTLVTVALLFAFFSSADSQVHASTDYKQTLGRYLRFDDDDNSKTQTLILEDLHGKNPVVAKRE